MVENSTTVTQGNDAAPISVEARNNRLEVPLAQMGFWQRIRIGRRSRALILMRTGEVETRPFKKSYVAGTSGVYIADPTARFYNSYWIPPGFLTIYVEQDAEAITDREPKGFGPKTIEMLLGKYPIHVVRGGYEGKSLRMPPARTILMIVASIIGLGVTLGYLYVTRWS